MENHHLKKSVSSRQELAHDNLKQLLALEILLVTGKFDLKLRKESWDLIFLEVHDGIEDTEDRVQDELVERTLAAVARCGLGPLLGLG
jgi:hypothetical protein